MRVYRCEYPRGAWVRGQLVTLLFIGSLFLGYAVYLYGKVEDQYSSRFAKLFA